MSITFDEDALEHFRHLVEYGSLPSPHQYTSIEECICKGLFWLQCHRFDGINEGRGMHDAKDEHSLPIITAFASPPKVVVKESTECSIDKNGTARDHNANTNNAVNNNKRARKPSFKLMQEQYQQRQQHASPVFSGKKASTASSASAVAVSELEDIETCVYPSEHTCFLLNFWGPIDAYNLDGHLVNRYGRTKKLLPPLYLSCPFNYEIDSSNGELMSYECVSLTGMEKEDKRAMREEAVHMKVQECCNGLWFQEKKSKLLDWSAYMRKYLLLDEWYECFLGDTFVGNAKENELISLKRTCRGKKEASFAGKNMEFTSVPIYSLCRCLFANFFQVVLEKHSQHRHSHNSSSKRAKTATNSTNVNVEIGLGLELASDHPDVGFQTLVGDAGIISEIGGASEGASGGIEFGGRAGCVLVLREGPKDSQPFGVWFTFVFTDPQTFFFVDVQNRKCSRSLNDAVENLCWAEPARPYVFYALWKPFS